MWSNRYSQSNYKYCWCINNFRLQSFILFCLYNNPEYNKYLVVFVVFHVWFDSVVWLNIHNIWYLIFTLSLSFSVSYECSKWIYSASMNYSVTDIEICIRFNKHSYYPYGLSAVYSNEIWLSARIHSHVNTRLIRKLLRFRKSHLCVKCFGIWK